jgi:UDP-N-acetylmuramoyl-tripeptide--D-alanyl-D-alanine ligase
MLELGAEGEALHRACGARIAQRGIDFVLGVRGLAKALVDGASGGKTKTLFVERPQAAGEWLAQNLRAGDTVLLKASRGVVLEDALKVLERMQPLPTQA